MRELLTELRIFFNRDLQDYELQDYYSLSQKARLTLLIFLGILVISLFVGFRAYFLKPESYSEKIADYARKTTILSANIELQKELLSVIKESDPALILAEVKAFGGEAIFDYEVEVQEAAVKGVDAKVVDEKGIDAKEIDVEGLPSSTQMSESELVAHLRAALGSNKVRLTSLLPQRQSIVFKERESWLIEGRKAYAQRDRQQQFKQPLSFSGLFAVERVGMGQSFLQTQEDLESNAPKLSRFVVEAQICSTYSDLLRSLNKITQEIHLLVVLDQWRNADSPTNKNLNPCVENDLQHHFIKLSFYQLPALYRYWATSLAHETAYVATDIATDIATDQQSMAAAMMSSLSIQETITKLSKDTIVDDNAFLNREGNDQGDLKLPFQQLPRTEIMIDSQMNRAEVTLDYWRIGERYQGMLLLGVLYFNAEKEGGLIIVKNRSEELETLTSTQLWGHFGHHFMMRENGVEILFKSNEPNLNEESF